MKCPYCGGELKIVESILKIGSYNIECENGCVWVDEDDV